MLQPLSITDITPQKLTIQGETKELQFDNTGQVHKVEIKFESVVASLSENKIQARAAAGLISSVKRLLLIDSQVLLWHPKQEVSQEINK